MLNETKSTVADSQERNVVLDDRPPPINDTEKDLPMSDRATLATQTTQTEVNKGINNKRE